MDRRTLVLPIVLAFMSDVSEERYLTHALHDLVTVYSVGDVTRILSDIGSESAAALVIHLDRRPPEVLAMVASRVRRAHQFLPIIGYGDSRAVASRQIQSVMSAGATHLVLRGTDNPRATIGDAIADFSWQAAAADVLRCIDGMMPDRARDVIAYCLAHIHEELSVTSIADGVRLCRRTLVRHLAGVASLEATISWTRLLMAASLMRRREWTVQRTALALNFASASALRTMLRRHANLAASQIRNHDGLDHVWRAFTASCGGTRRASLNPPKPPPPKPKAPSCSASALQANIGNGALFGAAAGAFFGAIEGAQVGAVGVGGIGAIGGAVAGTTIGPVGTVVGTFAGATGGGILGGIAGGWVGAHIGAVFGTLTGITGAIAFTGFECVVGK